MSGPPFDRYPVSSADIRAKGDAIAKSSKPLVAVKDAMDGPRQKAADAVDGELDGQIEGPVEPAQRDAMTSAAGADLCGGAISLFANYVDLFNRGVDDLNTRWNDAVQHDFDIPGSDEPAADHDADVAEARGVMAAELRKEFAEIEGNLDDGARAVATILNKGPEEGAPLLAAYTGLTGMAIVLGKMFPSSKPLTPEDIMEKYQVGDDPDGLVMWEPPWPASLKTEPTEMTAAEAAMLDDLGLLAMQDMKDMHDDAFSAADERFTREDRNDNHNDAFRHAYWNAQMTRRFGEDWAENYANAHEGRPGNQQAREAMDLYNNEVGRKIAVENPDASDEEVANLIEQAVRDGEMLVVGPDGNLVWSNTIQEGDPTGDANNLPEGPADGNPDNDPEVDADPDSENDQGTGS